MAAVLVIGGSKPAAANAPALLPAPTASAASAASAALTDAATAPGQLSNTGSIAGTTAESATAADSSATSPVSPTPSSQSPPTSGATSSSQTPSSVTAGTSETSVTPFPTSVGATVVPATPPAAVQSEIGRGTVLIAVGVLLVALSALAIAVGVTRRRKGTSPAPASTSGGPARQWPPPEHPLPSESPGPTEPTLAAETTTRWSSPVDGSPLYELMAVLVELGDTMVDSGDPVTHVRDTLQRVAEINGVPAAEIIVLPTALIITLPGMEEARTEVAATGESKLRLDQVEAVFTVADAAESGELGPRAALAQLRAARERPPSFGPVVIVAGHAVIAMGLAVILSGGWTEIAVAAVLGAGVGVIKQWAADRRLLAIQVFLPVSCAFLVAVAVALLARTELDPAVLPPILGALVTFIPGGLLTTAVIELATGQMISGASRFVYGSLQLVLLSLGIVGGLQLVGIPAITVAESDTSLISALAPWFGVLVFGAGVLLSYAGRPASFGWMLMVLYVAYAGQVIGGLLFGSSLSAFVGAAVMTPVAVFVATHRTGPPTLVTFLPAFWLLVPGAIALVGVTQVMGEATVDGVSAILGAGVTIVSIALGVVLGLSVGEWVKSLIRN